MATPFVPSSLQAAYFDWMRTGSGSAILMAVAGSGKSTSIQEGLPILPERASVQVLVFNAPIAKEWKERMMRLSEREGRPFANVRVGTFHSLGFNAVGRKLGRRVEPDSRKLEKLAEQMFIAKAAKSANPEAGLDDLETHGDFICKLVGFARGVGIGVLVPDTEAPWYELIQHHDMFLDGEDIDEATAVEYARELLQRSNMAAREGHIDFDDMLYLPLLWKLRLWQNDWVFVDEAQDTNPVRRALAKLALKPGGRLVAVGDDRQGIYAFTGASHDAMDLIRREFSCVDLPLTTCYRCSKAVVRHAQAIVPHIEAHEDAPEGSVTSKPLQEALTVLGSHDAILCRNTAPLVSLAFTLIANGRACKVLGRDIGTGLIKLVQKMKAPGIDALWESLTVYRDREVAKFTAKGEEAKAEAVLDRVQCLQVLIDQLPETERTVRDLCRRIDGMFTDENGVLLLSTAHKSKGREWNNVAILRPDLMPSKWARQEHQQVQEQNLMYVARTRARLHLIYLTDETVRRTT